MVSSVPAADVELQGRAGWLHRYAAFVETMYVVRGASRRLPIRVSSLLHPRHPLPQEQLDLLRVLNGEGSLPPTRTLLRIVHCLLGALRDTAMVLAIRLRYGRRVAALRREPADVLIKTWAFGSPLTQEGEDFYFGDLQPRLEAQGVRTVVLSSDVRRGPTLGFAAAALRLRDRRVVPEWILVAPWAPLAVAADQLASWSALRRMASRIADPALRTVCAAASLDVLRPSVTRSALYFHVARTAVRTWRPRAFVTLYEGYPWESAVWQATKQAAAECHTVGYQHTVILPHAFGVLRPAGPGRAWGPEIVLCLGDVTRRMLEQGHRAVGTTLIPFGTFRRAVDAPPGIAPRPRDRVVLVLPEGVMEEARLLTDTAVRLAGLLSDHRIVLRFHPNLSFDAIRASLRLSTSLPANVEVSGRAGIEDDFRRASAVLYRGSSAVLYAVLHGLKPLYLDDGRHETDPLFALDVWRERVAGPEELAAALSTYAQAEEGIVSEWRIAEHYVRSYVPPVNQESLNRFLGVIGVAAGR